LIQTAVQFIGVLLAITNCKLLIENTALRELAETSEARLHTFPNQKVPPLQGKDLEHRDLNISFAGAGSDTLMFVFSPTCTHCEHTWSNWLDLAKGRATKRNVFVNIGGTLTPTFIAAHPTASGILVAQTEPESILRYNLLVTPITLLVTSDGRCKRVWSGELYGSRLDEVRKEVGWHQY